MFHKKGNKKLFQDTSNDIPEECDDSIGLICVSTGVNGTKNCE